VGPIGSRHDEGIIWLFIFQTMKLFVVVVLNLLLVEFFRLYERTKDFGASLNSILQLPLSWNLVANATVPIWQSKARKFANLVLVSKIGLVSIHLRGIALIVLTLLDINILHALDIYFVLVFKRKTRIRPGTDSTRGFFHVISLLFVSWIFVFQFIWMDSPINSEPERLVRYTAIGQLAWFLVSFLAHVSL
jgi:hypothetical protein